MTRRAVPTIEIALRMALRLPMGVRVVPQCGHLGAAGDMFFPQSGHRMSFVDVV
jgi:hypothetical protein